MREGAAYSPDCDPALIIDHICQDCDPEVGKWIQLAQTAALGSHPYVLEDGPELPKIPGRHADEGGEVLEVMYADGYTSIDQAGIQGISFPSDNEDEEAMTYDQKRLLRRFRKGRRPGTVSGTSPHPAGIVSKDPRVVPT
jgi:hypothetical protein